MAVEHRPFCNLAQADFSSVCSGTGIVGGPVGHQATMCGKTFLIFVVLKFGAPREFVSQFGTGCCLGRDGSSNFPFNFATAGDSVPYSMVWAFDNDDDDCLVRAESVAIPVTVYQAVQKIDEFQDFR